MPVSLDDALKSAPIFAVLRGMPASEALAVGAALVEAGITVLEVTLDSDGPFESLRAMDAEFGDRALVAAGTVLSAEDAGRAADAGARMIVAPNFSPAVVEATKRAGALSAPGVATPTEAFEALACGADLLKLFPGDILSPNAVKSLRAVLPAGTRLVVTGGVDAATLPEYLKRGASGVGVGSALYAPGKPVAEIARDAAAVVAAARAACATG